MRQPDEPQPALGAAIRSLRSERGARQLDLAEDAGITVSHLSRIETGKVNPTWATIAALAEALGVTMVEVARRTAELEG